MRLVIIDSLPDTKAALWGRANEAARQAEVRRVEIIEVELNDIESFDWTTASGCLIGPGCYEDLESVVERVKMAFPSGNLAVVLENEIYASDAVLLRKRLNIGLIALGDLAQIASFLIDCDSLVGSASTSGNRGVIGVCQFKGGVGTTTLTAALGACWARHGLSVVMVDLDDVNPQLTAWSRASVVHRTVCAELLRRGEVPANRINELVYPVEGYEGRLVVVPQPETYNEGFQFKANVLDGAPSAAEFINSLIERLRAEFDAVLIDMGRSWGVATFSALKLCEHVLLVTDDDGMSVRRTLDGLIRLKKETDDPEEFDLSKWALVLNAYTARLISPKDLAEEISEIGLFGGDASLFSVPFSDTGRQWGAPGKSLYDMSDHTTQNAIRKIAYSLIPFRFEQEEGFGEKLKKRLQNLVHA